MPVGTLGVVKTLSTAELTSLGAEILLGNAYHLTQRPGLDVLEHCGGLHRFMGWSGPLLTDSGGFQVFSLGKLKSIDDERIIFQSHVDGSTLHLTPESSAAAQQIIGADIAMVLDECVALPASRQALEKAVFRSLRWAERFVGQPRKPGQAVFGIVQGGCEIDLRQLSLTETMKLGVDGIAIGGLSVGEGHDAMIHTLKALARDLPPDRPHYLMGAGNPLDILEAVRQGIDMFDCVLPTRVARNAGFFTDDGLINIRNQCHRLDSSPIDPNCPCPCCRQYSRAYLRHLFQSKEILGCRLATTHNLHYYFAFMQRIREAIESGSFDDFCETMRSRLVAGYGPECKLEME